MVMQGGCVKDPPMPMQGGGILWCDCDCHKPIGQQTGDVTSCEHCRIMGGVYTGMLEPDPDDEDKD